MLGCKPTNTPIEVNHQLGNEGGTFHTLGSISKVGKKIYLYHTRLDIAYEIIVII